MITGQSNGKRMKPIDTEYNGCMFRSRLEARWAIFFDAMGVEWSYEVEGFQFEGHRYLPDFWVPAAKVFVEIKRGDIREHDNREYIRAQILQSLMDAPLWVIYGNPWPGEYVIESPEYPHIEECLFAEDRRAGTLAYEMVENNGWGDFIPSGLDHERHPLADGDKITAAYKKARQARFEHGDNTTRKGQG